MSWHLQAMAGNPRKHRSSALRRQRSQVRILSGAPRFHPVLLDPSAELFPEHPRALRRDRDRARALDAADPTGAETALAQGGAERAGDMRAALAPVEAGPAKNPARARTVQHLGVDTE